MRYVFTLPFPPSVNALRKAERSSISDSKKYNAWKNEALWSLKLDRAVMPYLEGPLHYMCELMPPNGKKRDLDNYATKAILDILQKYGAFKDDSQIVSIYAEWASEDAGFIGARVTLSGMPIVKRIEI